MDIRIIISISYAIVVNIVELLIEKRLRILRDRHQQKIWWGYASWWLVRLHNFLTNIIRILFILLYAISLFLTFILL